jgi:hypothetical protein
MMKSLRLFGVQTRFIFFGPGEAKGEFEKRLAHEGVKTDIAVETVDKMTDGQIVAKVTNILKNRIG